MREIETTRLLLRMFAPDDLDDLSLIFSDPDVVRHLGTGLPLRREETEQALSGIVKHWERHGFGRWAVVFKTTGKLIGYGGLRCFQETPELVYLLAKPYWGIGLATEMAQAALRYGFEAQQFERILGMAKVANIASQRVLEKIGMSFEKTATICEMEVACYSISRDAYLSETNPSQDSLAA
jgi:RimJ/RimL family protein N-acetyltransferase